VLVSLGRRVRHTAGGFGLPLAFLALISAILAMARPVWRNEYQSRTASGIDIMIAFDVSLSMDIDDFVDHGERVRRIDVAKAVVDDFISRRPMTAWAWSPSPAARATPARSRSTTSGCETRSTRCVSTTR
jgi:Ca-activated chloride channel homolog